jgi:hypothetical protein
MVCGLQWRNEKYMHVIRKKLKAYEKYKLRYKDSIKVEVYSHSYVPLDRGIRIPITQW